MARNARSDAEARFTKVQVRQREAAEAMSDAAKEARRIDENTARLKALRLARDARLAEEAAAAADEKAAALEAKAAAKTAKAAKKAAPKTRAKTA